MLGEGAEAKSLVEGNGGGVRLVHVQLYAGALAFFGAAQRTFHEGGPQTRASGGLADEEILEPAVAGGVPHAVTESKLADRCRLPVGPHGSQQVLRVRVGDQAIYARGHALVARKTAAQPVAKLDEEAGHGLRLVGLSSPDHGHRRTLLAHRPRPPLDYSLPLFPVFSVTEEASCPR